MLTTFRQRFLKRRPRRARQRSRHRSGSETQRLVESLERRIVLTRFTEVTGAASPFADFAGELSGTPHLADLDDDGDLDLLLFRLRDESRYFENVGTVESPSFVDRSAEPDLPTLEDVREATGLGLLNQRFPPGNPSIAQPYQELVSLPFLRGAAFTELDASPGLDMVLFEDVTDEFGQSTYPARYFSHPGSNTREAIEPGDNPFRGLEFSQPVTPYFVDINADGDTDLAGIRADGSLFYVEHSGRIPPSGFPRFHDVSPAEASPFAGIELERGSRLAFGDINDDGHVDMLVRTPDNELQYFEALGARLPFIQHTRIPDVGAFPALADLDGDGDLDLASGNNNGTVSYFENTDAGFVSRPELLDGIVPRGFSYSTVAFVDIDGDSDTDLLVNRQGGSHSNLRLVENIGTPTEPEFQEHPDGIPGVPRSYYGAITAGDIDGDGDWDLLAAGEAYDSTLHLFRNDGSATSPQFSDQGTLDVALPGTPSIGKTGIVLHDVDGDGDLDLLGNDPLTLYRNIGSPTEARFEAVTGADNPFLVASGQYRSAAVGDVNGDGVLDVVTGDLWNTLRIFHGTAVANGESAGAGSPEAGQSETVSHVVDHDGPVGIRIVNGRLELHDEDDVLASALVSDSTERIELRGRNVEGNDLTLEASLDGFAGELVIVGGAGTDTVRIESPDLRLDLTTSPLPWTNVEVLDIAGFGGGLLTLDANAVTSITGESNTLTILRDASDVIELDADWSLVRTYGIDGLEVHEYEDNGATLRVQRAVVYRSDIDGINGLIVDRYLNVIPVGDVNGDGFDDVAVRNERIVFGSGEGLSPDALAAPVAGTGFTIVQPYQNNPSMKIVAAGDVNGDGIDDLMIGFARADVDGIRRRGAAHVLLGRPDFEDEVRLENLDGTNGFRVAGRARDVYLDAVGPAGDVNGDGFDDIALTQNPNLRGQRDNLIVFGAARLPALMTEHDLDGTNGFAVGGLNLLYGDPRSLGDVNNDGFDDVGFHDDGEVSIVYGQSGAFPRTGRLHEFLRTHIDLSFAHRGRPMLISPAGDVNDDGIDDVLVGAEYANVPGRILAGSVFVLYGTADGLGEAVNLDEPLGSRGVRFDGMGGRGRLGRQAEGLGDVNGDGIDDIVVAAPFFNAFGKQLGHAYVVAGWDGEFPDRTNVRTFEPTRSVRLSGAEHGDEVGRTVYSLGDVNGDGRQDYLIGNLSFSGGLHQVIIYGGSFLARPDGLVEGTSGNDILTATGGADVGDQLFGAAGDDELTSDGGPDALIGGVGDDVLTIVDSGFRRIDGGAGVDTLRAGRNDMDIDLTSIPVGSLTSIEEIDLRDAGTNTLTLTADRLRRLDGRDHRYVVRRDSQDTVVFGPGWTDAGSHTIDGLHFRELTSGNVTLTVEADPAFPIDMLNGRIEGVDLQSPTLPGPGNYTLSARAAGGTRELVITSDDDGAEISMPATTGRIALVLSGSSGDDALRVADSPLLRQTLASLVFLGDTGGQDALELVGDESVDPFPEVRYLSDAGNRLVIANGGFLVVASTQQMTITDLLPANVRSLAARESELSVALQTDAANPDRVAAVFVDTTLPRLVFAAPTELLQIEGTDHDDSVTISPLPTAFTGGIEFHAGAGNDSLDALGVTQSVTALGGSGNDSLLGGAGPDALYGGIGNDRLRGRGGIDTLGGDAGDDTLDGGNEDDVRFEHTEAAETTVTGTADAATIVGLGTDTLRDPLALIGIAGNDASNRIDARGFSGPLTVLGRAGDDTLLGGSGDDLIDGGTGNDVIAGNAGNDTLDAGSGDGDRLVASVAGQVTLTDSQLSSVGGETDELRGGFDRANVSGGGQADRIDASAFSGSLVLRGGAGRDTLIGGPQNDTLYGSAGADELYGGGGEDTLLGGGGPDFIDGGAGQDNMRGQGGRDRIVKGFDDRDRSRRDAQDLPPILRVTGDATFTTGDLTRFGGVVEIYGDDGPNRIDVSAVSIHVRVFGHGGDDTLIGGSQGNELFGGDGNDELIGGAADDWLDGEAGDDNLDGAAGNNTLTGGLGNDTLKGDTSTDVRIERADTNMTVSADGSIPELGTDQLTTALPLVGLIGGRSSNRIDASAFASPLHLRGEGGNDTIIGGPSDDTIEGGSGADVLEGRAGADEISGSFGHDTLRGGDGNDRLSGNQNNDVLLGGSGNDSLNGGDGNDRIKGHSGNDTLGGAGGNDLLEGGPDADVRIETVRNHVTVTDTGITGIGTDNVRDGLTLMAIIVDGRVRRGLRLNARNFSGPITLIGGAGNDSLTGGMQSDLLVGGPGNDRLTGRGGNDRLFGESGNDRLAGGAGADGLNGGDDNDSLFGEGGVDKLAGGAGTNQFDGDTGEIDETFGNAFRLLLDAA